MKAECLKKKISLTQQDDPRVSAEIFAGTISRLRWSGSRRSPAAAAPPASTEMPQGCFIP